jgi:hypothetical protein
MAPIPLHILLELLLPESYPALRNIGVLATLVSVPVASMNKNHSMILWKENVWSSREILTVQSETVACHM